MSVDGFTNIQYSMRYKAWIEQLNIFYKLF